MKRFSKSLSVVLAVCLMVPFFTSCSGSKDKVVIFSSMEDYRNEYLREQLKEKFPDIETEVQQLATGNHAAKIKAEGADTEASISIALETASYLPIADNFASLTGLFEKNDYIEGVELDDDRCFTWDKFESAFIVNTEVLAEKGLPEPKNYEDLLKPEYKGLIAMPNPKTSGTGYMFLNNWYNIMGEDEAFSYVDKLQENVKQFTESGSGPIKLLNQGEIAIGLGMVFQASEQINQGMPLKIIIPEEGAPYNTTIIGIIKGKETNENVKTIFNYLNTEFFKYDKENFIPGKIVKDQQVKLENYPTDIKLADVSTIFDADLKQRLTEKWKY